MADQRLSELLRFPWQTRRNVTSRNVNKFKRDAVVQHLDSFSSESIQEDRDRLRMTVFYYSM